MRYFIQLSYKGTEFKGWQNQPNGISIQESLEKALSSILRRPTTIVGSGRTDSGVHAEQQFAHFEVEEPLTVTAQLVYALNCILPAGIAVQAMFPVEADMHARYSAEYRYYQYRISRHKNPFLQKQIYVFRPELEVSLMNEAAGLLLQYTDFQSFSKVRTSVNHFHCTITRAEWLREGDQLIFHVKANRFLYGMVRTLVGTLLEVGQGRMTVADFEQIILARDRTVAGRSVPPDGLFLVEVGYPSEVLQNRFIFD
ncbi:tRNA pseudouridine(38-40) synthase TruA [Nibrella saemangeumensis]|uniref:tRNA pseudouridine synthase A n=1 Tax=Nibrella saemangeumensis TaxID=1084526 RepID=A0ABP8NKC6_9BACT